MVMGVRRPALLALTWVAGTALAVALAWGAVGFVSSEVTNRRAAPISNDEVAAALASPSQASTTTSAVAPFPGPTTVPVGAGAATSTSPAPTGTVRATLPSGSTKTTTTAPAAAPSTTPASAPTTLAPATTTVIPSTGGQVAVRYEAGRVELLWAQPQAGFQADVDDDGPGQVDVRFETDTHESRVRAFFRDGAPAQEVREQER